jgi:hypothetical protein
MHPPPNATEPTRRGKPPLPRWVRGGLLLTAAGLILVFVLAAVLNPYTTDAAGNRLPRTMETHTQLGLPPCNFKVVTGLPCPSCGMTTSFSLLVHGDVLNSLRANAVGTLLALFWMALVPWSLLSAWRGKYLFVRKLEPPLLWAVGVLLALMLARWGVVVAARVL